MAAEQLVVHARRARTHAYAPYSHYFVGAAVLTRAGEVFTGCNIENASFGLTICAERVAMANAIAAGQRDFVMLALITANGGSPCGACRQVMIEFCDIRTRIHLVNKQGLQKTFTLGELLPEAFNSSDLI